MKKVYVNGVSHVLQPITNLITVKHTSALKLQNMQLPIEVLEQFSSRSIDDETSVLLPTPMYAHHL
jgi:hypothetical protein